MHTALVSRILRDKSMWEEVTSADVQSEDAPVYRAGASVGSSL